MANPKVLVVEDDEVILSLEKRWLAKLGFDVCGSAGTGAEALDCVAKMQPEIVLMDIGLDGDMDGIEAVGHIKKNSTIPVIFVTAHTGGKSSHVPKQSILMVLSKSRLMMMTCASPLSWD